MKGKTVTIILLLSIFMIGLAIIIFDPDRFNPFVTLVQLMLAPMLVIMGGIAGQSIAKVIKGEAKIEDAAKAIADNNG
jgi:hypothetical protein